MSFLRDAFLGALPPELRDPLATRETLEVDLKQAVDRAREKWSSFEVAPEVFVRYLGARVQSEHDDLVHALRHASDLYLACAIADGKTEAMHEFERAYVAKLRIGRLRLSDDELDEVKQILRQQFLMGDAGRPPKIVDYSGLGELSAWLRVAAVRAAIKLRKGRTDEAVGDDALQNMPGFDRDAELKYVQAEHRVAFRESLRQAIASLKPEEQNVLRQHYLDGLTIDQLAALYRVHRTTCAYWIERARDRLLRRTRLTLMKATRMSASDCDSLFREVQSQFAITLSSLFR